MHIPMLQKLKLLLPGIGRAAALALGFAVIVGGMVLGLSPAALAQDTADKPKPKKVWTDDDLRAPATSKSAQGAGSTNVAANGAGGGAADGVSGSGTRATYTRDKDPKWYARQMEPLREELAKIDTEMRSLQEARKDGKGASDAVNLDEEPEGVTADGQMDVLKAERAELVRQIDDLEEQARHNSIAPGNLRDQRLLLEDGSSMTSGAAIGSGTAGRLGVGGSDVARELQSELTEGKEQLERSTKEADLLSRDLTLEKQQEGSSPEPHSRRDKAQASVQTSALLGDKRLEEGDLEKKIAELEDKLKEEQLNAPAASAGGAGKAAGTAPENAIDDALANAADVEAQWRKQFASIDYKIRVAKTELDILQRELNLQQLQYSPNPATTMKEEYSQKKINEQRQAIDNKKKQLVTLNGIRAQLEEELRHAGGPAGLARQ